MLDRKYNQIKYSYYLFIKHEDKLDSFDHLLQITRKLGFRHCCTKTTLKSAHVLAFSAYKPPPRDVHNVSLCYKKTQWPKPSGCIILSSAVFFGNKCEDWLEVSVGGGVGCGARGASSRTNRLERESLFINDSSDTSAQSWVSFFLSVG